MSYKTTFSYLFGIAAMAGVIFIGFFYQQTNFSFSPNQYTASIIDAVTSPYEKILNSLTTQQKISQLFILGTNAQTPQETKDFIEQNQVGGVILLTKNFQTETQTKDLIRTLQETSNTLLHIPLLITVDQEGGDVSRVPFNVDSTPQPEIISPAQAYTVAKQRGMELKALGINMNLAPVLDVITNPQSFLYERIFQGDVQKISQQGLLSVQGYQDAHILSCIKHFPGHGDALTDPHTSLSVNKQSNQEIQANIQPFTQAISAGAPCVMVGHVINTILTPLPASQSPEVISLLRTQEKFNGVIMTDDMEMVAARLARLDSTRLTGDKSKLAHPNQTIAQASLAALQAGTDMVLISGYTTTPQEQEQIIQEVTQKIESGALTQDQLNEKLIRIIKMKSNL